MGDRKRGRVYAAAFIALCLLLAALASCGSPPSAENETLLSEDTVTDASGNTLRIPLYPEEATIASDYAVALPFIVALRLEDRVLAINAKSSFWTENVPSLAKAGSVGRGAVDYEKLASYDPTVLIHRAGDPKTVSGAERIGVPVLSISAEDYEGIVSTIDLMGRYFGADTRAEEVKAWMDAKFAKIDAIVAGIPEAERLSAICLGSTLGRVAGSDMLQTWMIEKAGGLVSAEDIKNNERWADIGVEKVLALDPEIIFLTSSTVLEYDEADLKDEPVWKGARAVKGDGIYRIPAARDSWDLPGISCVAGTFYMLRSMYPDHFSEEEYLSEAGDYYRFMFGRSLDRDIPGY